MANNTLKLDELIEEQIKLIPAGQESRHQPTAASSYEAILPVAFIIFFMVLLFVIYLINTWGMSGLRKRVKRICECWKEDRVDKSRNVMMENPYLYTTRPVSTSVQTSSSRPTTSTVTTNKMVSHYSDATRESVNQQFQAIAGQVPFNDANNNRYETDSVVLYKIAGGGGKPKFIAGNQVYPLNTANLMLALNKDAQIRKIYEGAEVDFAKTHGEVYFSGKNNSKNSRIIYKDEEQYDDIEMETFDNQMELSHEPSVRFKSRNDDNNNNESLSPLKIYEQHSSRKSQSRRLSSGRYRPTPVRPRTPRYLPGHDKRARGRISLTNSVLDSNDQANFAVKKSLFKNKPSRSKNSLTMLRQQDMSGRLSSDMRRSSPIETPQLHANMLKGEKPESLLYRPKISHSSNVESNKYYTNIRQKKEMSVEKNTYIQKKYLPSKSYSGLMQHHNHQMMASMSNRTTRVIHKSPTLSSDTSHVINMNMINHSTASPTTTTTTSTTTTTTTSNSGYAKAHIRIDSADDTTISSSFSYSLDNHQQHHAANRNSRFPNAAQLPFSPIKGQPEKIRHQHQTEKVIQFKIVKSQSAFIESSLSSSLASGSISYNPAKSLFPQPMPLRKRIRNLTNDENINKSNEESGSQVVEMPVIYTENELLESNAEYDDADFEYEDDSEDNRKLSRNSHRSSTFKGSKKNHLRIVNDQNEIEVKKSSTDSNDDQLEAQNPKPYSHIYKSFSFLAKRTSIENMDNNKSKIKTGHHGGVKRLSSAISQQLTKLKPKMSFSASTSRLTTMIQTMKNSISQEGAHVYLEDEVYGTNPDQAKKCAHQSQQANRIINSFRSMNSLVLEKLNTANISFANGKNWTKMVNEKEAATCNHEAGNSCSHCNCANCSNHPKQVSDAAVQTSSIVNSNSSSFNSQTTTLLQTNTFGSIVANLGSASLSHRPKQGARPFLIERILKDAGNSQAEGKASTGELTSDAVARGVSQVGGMKTSFTIGTCMSTTSTATPSNLVKALSNDDACKLTIDFN